MCCSSTNRDFGSIPCWGQLRTARAGVRRHREIACGRWAKSYCKCCLISSPNIVMMLKSSVSHRQSHRSGISFLQTMYCSRVLRWTKLTSYLPSTTALNSSLNESRVQVLSNNNSVLPNQETFVLYKSSNHTFIFSFYVIVILLSIVFFFSLLNKEDNTKKDSFEINVCLLLGYRKII